MQLSLRGRLTAAIALGAVLCGPALAEDGVTDDTIVFGQAAVLEGPASALFDAQHQAACLFAARPSSAAFASLVMRRMISPAGRTSVMLPALCPAVRQACAMSPLKSRVGRMAL